VAAPAWRKAAERSVMARNLWRTAARYSSPLRSPSFALADGELRPQQEAPTVRPLAYQLGHQPTGRSREAYSCRWLDQGGTGREAYSTAFRGRLGEGKQAGP